MAHGKLKILLMALVLLCITSLPVHAALFGFSGITNNNSYNVGIGEAQLFMDVTDAGSGQVSFDFVNLGPEASTVARIYFDYTFEMFSDWYFHDLACGVSFSEDASPPNLPGGKPFGFGADFSLGADPAPPKNGINPGESLEIIFDLAAGFTFSDVIQALLSSDLQIGIHVIAFDSGDGESFINNPQIVPLPPTIILMGTGLFGLIGMRKRLKG
jgi:hypothetical protein